MAEEAKLPKLLYENYRINKVRSIFAWLKDHTNKMKNFRDWNDKRTSLEDGVLVKNYFDHLKEEFEISRQRKQKEKVIEKSIIKKFLTLWVFELNSRSKL